MNLMPQIIILMNYWVSICPGSGKMCLVFLASYPMKFLIKCHTFSGQHHGEIQKGQVSCETPINLSSVLESDSCLTSLLCFLFFLNKKHTLCFLMFFNMRNWTKSSYSYFPPPLQATFWQAKTFPSHIFSRQSCCSNDGGTQIRSPKILLFRIWRNTLGVGWLFDTQSTGKYDKLYDECLFDRPIKIQRVLCQIAIFACLQAFWVDVIRIRHGDDHRKSDQ